MFPDRTEAIEIHRDNARRLFAAGKHDEARPRFLKWVEAVRQQNVNVNGALDSELQAAQREYSQFAKSDPLYLKICDSLIPLVGATPDILQTDVYKALPTFQKHQLSYALYFAADHGKITGTKTGRTYKLTLKDREGGA